MGGARRKQLEGDPEDSVEGKKAKVESVLNGDEEGAANNLPSRSDAADDAVTVAATQKDLDAQHLLNIFPEEVWLLIFDATSDLTILENLGLASPFFYQLLLPKKVLSLFPKVWEILGVKYETELDPAYMDYELTEEDYRSNFIPRPAYSEAQLVESTRKAHVPWFRTMQKFRLVCKTWGQAVDAFYGNHPRHYKMKDDLEQWKLSEKLKSESVVTRADGNGGIGSWGDVKFSQREDPEKLDKFSAHFGLTHGDGAGVGTTTRSPFISRTVSFESVAGQTPEDQEETLQAEARRFWDQISTILLQYGQHIWNIVLEIRDHFTSPVDYYSKLREWMELMPNLKCLDIRYSRVTMWRAMRTCCRGPWAGPFTRHKEMSPEELTHLERETMWNPLPKIESLVCIKTTDLPSPIVNHLIRHNCHVSMLEVREREAKENNYDIYSVPMPNLSQLSVKIKRTEDIGRLGTLPVDWPLTKLYVDFADCPFVEWPIIFSLLQDKWADTLTNLVIALPEKKGPGYNDNPIMRDYSTLRLELPKLRRLKLGISNYTSMDFLLPMKDTLQFLEISQKSFNFKNNMKTYRSASAFDRAQVIDNVLIWRYKTAESNIWTLFPKLKLIYYDQRNWQSRIDWEEVMEKKKEKKVRTPRERPTEVRRSSRVNPGQQ